MTQQIESTSKADHSKTTRIVRDIEHSLDGNESLDSVAAHIGNGVLGQIVDCRGPAGTKTRESRTPRRDISPVLTITTAGAYLL